MHHRQNRVLAAALIGAFSVTSIPAPAFASLVPTDRILSEQGSVSADRAQVNAFIAREDVRSKLQAYGVNPEEAATRVAALSDAEIAQLASRIDQMPAGQDAIGTIVGAALVVFLVLLVTDILCVTSVFPFTRCAR